MLGVPARLVPLVLVFSLAHGQSTQLREAARNGDDEAVRALLAAGADVDAKDNDGNTPLFLAVEQDHAIVADMLRAHGARE